MRPPYPLADHPTGAGALVGNIGIQKEVRACPNNEANALRNANLFCRGGSEDGEVYSVSRRVESCACFRR